MDKHRKLVVAGFAAALLGAAVAPAHAATGSDTQTVDATLQESITLSLNNKTVGSGTDAAWSLAANSATNTKAAGKMTVSTNGLTFSVTVLGEKATLTQWDPSLNTGAGAYVTGGKSLGAAMTVTATDLATSLALTPATVATTATAVVPAGTTISTTGTNEYSLQLGQATTFVDKALPAGHTYHNTLTYTATSAL